MLILGVAVISITGEEAQKLPFLHFTLENHSYVFGQVFAVPLIYKAIYLPRFLIALDVCVYVISSTDKPYAPLYKTPVYVPFHKLHVSSKPRLVLAKHNIKQTPLRIKRMF